MYEKFTFAKNSESKNSVSWTCSSRCSKKCNAQVVLTKQGEFTVTNGKHTHSPPVFYINGKGEYVRMQDKIVRSNDGDARAGEISTFRVIGAPGVPYKG